MITIIYEVVQELLTFYRWVVIVAAIVTTLIAFDVLDRRNRAVWMIGDVLYRLTEPALRPIRRFLPTFGGLDLSPLVLLLLIFVMQNVLARIYVAIRFGDTQGLLL